MKDVGGDRIDVFVAERLRRVLRHGTADIIEQGRGIGPIASDRPDRRLRRQRALAADQTVADTTLALCAMTGRALLIENFMAVTDAAAARRQVVAVALDVALPTRALGRCRRPAVAVR